jgi:hypothetical protein
MNERIFAAAAARFPLRERDIGAFAHIRGRGMTFEVKAYEAPGAGSLCLMEMRAMAGLMNMETAVFSPTGLDGPLFSMDAISAMGRDTLILELYNTTLSHPDFSALEEIRTRYASLSGYDPGEHWYDSMRLAVSDYKRGRKTAGAYDPYVRDYAQRYFALLARCARCGEEEKKRQNAVFADGLLQNGGPAVDQFRKMLGEEKTAEFLRTVMFRC